ncbi:MAG: hypothetical protein V4615_13440 [Bacteroidota bacterium]
MKHRLYSVSERTPNRLVLNRKSSRFLLGFIVGTAILLIWLSSLLQITDFPPSNDIPKRINELIDQPFQWIFVLAIFWIIYAVLSNLYYWLTGDQILVDKAEGLILKKHGNTVRISELKNLQIRKYTDSDNAVDYRLALIKDNGEKIFVDRASDRGGVIELAEEIGDFINKPIVFK